MPNPSLWGPLLGVLLVFSIVGPSFAGLTLLVTKHARTRYFWIFSAVFAVGAAWWLAGLVSPSHVFEELFRQPPGEAIRDLDYEIDREPDEGVLVVRFRTDAATAQHLARARSMEAVPAPDARTLVPSGLETPPWWPPPWHARARSWHERRVGPQYRALEAWLLFDAETGDARYVMVGRRVDPAAP